MEILSRYDDKRINSTNLYVETTIGEYLSFASKLIDNNEFQRRRVRSSKTVYSLLKDDIIKGCLMPPLVLAIRDVHLDAYQLSGEGLLDFIRTQTEKVSILDGLQRTYTLIDAQKEVAEFPNKAQDFNNYLLRIEIYVNINKFGVLYRMLTLNTGQTPMSTRHQLEMLYHDLLNTDIDGIRLISDNQGKVNPNENEFKFNDVIAGFNSYTNRDEKLIDRQDLLDNIRMMENMAKENIRSDLFEEFVSTYAKVYHAIVLLSDGYKMDTEDMDEYGITGNPFGKNATQILSKSQTLTGFGSAVGKMKDLGIISGLDDIKQMANDIYGDGQEWILLLNRNMNIISKESKKIGNSQRLYFHFIFRCLFNNESDGYLDMYKSIDEGYERYKGQAY